MQDMDSKVIDIIELISQLRNERLFVVSEYKAIKAANEKVRDVIDKLSQDAWINVQKNIILNVLAMSSSKATTLKCWQNLNVLANTTFIHAKDVLNYQELNNYRDLLQILRSKPEILAHFVVLGVSESALQEEVRNLINSLICGLYGALLLPEDISLVLSLLQQVAKLELVTSENPRRKLRHKSCAFSQLYFLFHENLPAAKLFLIASLRKPIMQVIAKKDVYLDVDSEKSLNRFLQQQKEEASVDEEAFVFRKKVVQELINFAKIFVNSIRESIFCFPDSFAWLIRQVSDLMAKNYGPYSKEVCEINTDLMFTLFICPAIVHPEAYGICDLSISDSVRHNLTQVAQIIQALALFQFNQLEPKYAEFHCLFETESAYDIINSLLKNSTNDHDLGVDHVPEVQRTTVLFSQEELNNMTSFLAKVIKKISCLNESQEIHKKMLSFKKLSNLPLVKQIENLLSNIPQQSEGIFKQPPKKVNQKKRSCSPNGNLETSKLSSKGDTVLILTIHQDKIQHIGLLPEHKVVGIQLNNEEKNCEDGQELLDQEQRVPAIVPSSVVAGSEKRIRFSRSHDESSMGNTSDNLEAVSEAASNHSVDSSVELENEDQNDNLSDMISANVSGRGSPNISGRDTPSSQVNDDDDDDNEGEAEAREQSEQEAAIEVCERAGEHPVSSKVQQIIDKHAQNEIDDKFCKFEIKKMLEGEETRSIISDTWSTDVLASDCETIDGNDGRTERQNIHLMVESQVVGGGVGPPGVPVTPLLDLSLLETKSESGWSTDVLASDSEHLTEVDADDVARLEDTVSVTRSDEGTSHNKARNAKSEKQSKMDAPCTAASESSTCNCQRCVLEFSVAGTNTSATAVAFQCINNFLRISSDGSGDASGQDERKTATATQQLQEQRISNNSEYNSSSSSTSSLESNKELEKANEVAKKVSQEKCVSSGPVLKSTLLNGAIPKSISFDASIDKGSDEEQKEKSSFLGKLRIGFRNRRGKSSRQVEDIVEVKGESSGFKRSVSGEETAANFSFIGTCDDILAKYRKPDCDNVSSVSSTKTSWKCLEDDPKDEQDRNVTFSNVKKKLRLVLSNSCGYHSTLRTAGNGQVKSDLESYLQLELAKAYKLNCRSCARITEALRCVKMSDEDTCLKLCTVLKEDYCQRSVYIQYLIQSRQLLLSILDFLERLSEQIENDKRLSSSYIASICVKYFFEKYEDILSKFKKEFLQLTLVDEKCYHLKEFLQNVAVLIRKEITWQDSTQVIQDAIERFVINQVYLNALYPNGDGDKDRDRVLQEHLHKLSKVISLRHKDLMISPCFQHECPWLPAQEALQDMASYRTPRDKVSCVLKCTQAIKDLLSLSSNKIPTADDFTPILVYVIIKANPANLLSTIQYIQGFIGDWLQGEDMYWWTQFCAAVEFTKTMDYCD